ncbi:MAG: oligosaccharide flippase family protein [Thermoguttaceae bacterium]|jgi:O-antigen/teichoic acid export membrane protein
MSVSSLASAYCPPFLRPAMERVQNSPIGYRLASGVFWSMAGAVISRGLMLVASVFVARLLGKTGYGELGIIRSTVMMFGVFAGFGLGLTATKYVAEFRQSDPARAGRIIGLSGLFATLTSGLMALGLFLFAPWLAEHTINAPHLAGVLRIGALILFISGINGAQTGALSGLEAFKTIAYVNLFTGLASFPVLIAGTYFGGLTGAVWATTVSLGLNWLLNHLALRREAARHHVPFIFENCVREWSVLWRFSLPAVLSGALVGPVTWACSALLVNRPGGYGEMGIYSAANQWFAILFFLPGLLSQVLLPVLSDQLGQQDIRQSMTTLKLAITLNLLVVAPFAILASVASPYIMGLYGDGFKAGWPTLVLVLVAATLHALETPPLRLLAAAGRMWLDLTTNAVWALILFVCTVLLVHLGAVGVAAANTISYLLVSPWIILVAILQIRRRLGDRGQDRPPGESSTLGRDSHSSGWVPERKSLAAP